MQIPELQDLDRQPPRLLCPDSWRQQNIQATIALLQRIGIHVEAPKPPRPLFPWRHDGVAPFGDYDDDD